jgi:hypothetical protein
MSGIPHFTAVKSRATRVLSETVRSEVVSLLPLSVRPHDVWYLLLGAQEITAEFVASFKDFPPPQSFNLDIAGDPPRFARDWHDLDQRHRIGCDRCYQGVQARRWGSRGVLP